MFGHDNQDDDNNDSQITLPPVEDVSQSDSSTSDAQDTSAQNDADQAVVNSEVGADTPDNPRKAPRSGAPTDELLDIKQNALQALTPLVDHLDQSPEERFRTTMMMIQASDNFDLIKTAYEAAGQISNEKERAQALLDIVNEINYFTQQQG